jgi:hypothetical protein
MSSFLRDVGYSVRLAQRRPALTLLTVMTLAVGIGGTSAIFSFANGLLLRPLPVAHAERLVRIFGQQDGRPYDVSSYANLSTSPRASPGSSPRHPPADLAAYGLGDDTETAAIELVSGNYSMLVRAAHGRLIDLSDDTTGGPQPVPW